ncbi:MAG: integrin [Planctomycetaceae bacterium]|nr:integrin [Planctomycetaceae bacterium]
MHPLFGAFVLVALPATALATTPVQTLAQEAYIKSSNPTNGTVHSFGGAIALSGDTLVVGAFGEDSGSSGVNGNPFNEDAPNSGAVYVYVRTAGVWTQQAYLKASNPAANNSFGISVALDGDTLVVGSTGQDSSGSNSGAAYVFVRSGGVWTQQAFLKASNPGASDNFGRSVGIHGNTLIVGAPNEDSNATGVNGLQSNNSAGNAGAAYVFARNGTAWFQQAYLKASNTETSDQFGYAVAIHGDTAVVGAVDEDSNAVGINGLQSNNSQSNAGAAYVFTRSETTWSQQAYIKASNTDNSDQFGIALALHGETLAVGSAGESSGSTGVNGVQFDETATDAGAAYVFVRSAGVWSQQAYIKASNTSAEDTFGSDLALDGDTLVVGAFNEDSNAVGVDGNGLDNSLLSAGAAYVFRRNGGSWGQTAYLKASNTEAGDIFGGATAVSGELVVCGASAEAGGIGGVNGNQLDNSAPQAGACYAFAPATNSFTVQNGCLGLNTSTLTSSSPGLVLGQPAQLVLTAGNFPVGVGLLYVGSDGTDDFGCGFVFPGLGEFLLGVVPAPTLLAVVPVALGTGQFHLAMPSSPSLVGIEVSFQAANADLTGGGVELTNALVSTVAP